VCSKATMPRDTIKETPVYKKKCMYSSVLAVNSIDRQNNSELQCGFRHSKSTTDKILCMCHILGKVGSTAIQDISYL
jgi:hypothetical protein